MGKMGRVRFAAQAVENQDVQALEFFATFRRNIVGVGAVGDVADAEAENVEPRAVVEAMREDEIRHRDTAVALGAAELPEPVRLGMRTALIIEPE